MRNIKDLQERCQDPEDKMRVQNLVRDIRREMLDLQSEFGIETGAVAYCAESNQI